MIKSKYNKTYVNCVKFLNENVILSSSGNILQVYNINTHDLLNNIVVFPSQRIHDIVLNELNLSEEEEGKINEFIVYGGEDLALFKISYKDQVKNASSDLITLEVVMQWKTNHWIQDVCFFEDNHYAVLGSSNILYLYERNIEDGIVLKQFEQCKEISVLYSGKIIGKNWDNCICICGTVFSQITIWSPLINDSNIVHRLKKHEGVIFSVTYNYNNQMICSTSDDRTLRIWKVFLNVLNTKGLPPKKYLFLHQLGRRNEQPGLSDSFIENWKYAKITLIYTIFGHSARVWKNIQLNNMKILTIGEDGQLKVWHEDECLYSWNTHQNSNVWSIDYNEKTNLIVTGGGDSGICLWPLIDSESNVTTPSEIGELTFNEDDFPRQLIITNNNKIILITNDGILLSHNIDDKKIILQEECLKSYCVLELSKCKKYIAACSIQGDIFIIDDTSETILCHFNIGNVKIFSLQWLDDDSFVVCLPDGMIHIYKLIINNTDDTIEYNIVGSEPGSIRLLLSRGVSIIKTNKLLLPPCRERWLTAALKINDLLIAGDRDGSIHAFNIVNEDMIATYHRVHSRLGVSAIEFVNDTFITIGRDKYLRYWKVNKIFESTQESVYCTYNNEISPAMCIKRILNYDTNESLTVNHVSANKLPIEWPAKIIFTHNDIYIIGFNQVSLLIWSNEEQKIILKLNCAGGHRSWDCSLNQTMFYFSYIKQKQIYHINIDLDKITKPTLSQCFHRDEINALKIIKLKKVNSKSSRVLCTNDSNSGSDPSIRIVVSGGEDNTIRLSYLEYNKNHFNNLNTFLILRCHISSVRCINYIQMIKNIFIVSGGGRAQLKIWRLNLNKDEFDLDDAAGSITNSDCVVTNSESNNSNDSKHVFNINVDKKNNDIKNKHNNDNDTTGFYNNIKNSLTCTELRSHMLNGEDKAEKIFKKNKPRINPETRYMDIALYSNTPNDDHFYIVTACSDGIIRIFKYITKHNDLLLIKEINHHKKCILKVSVIKYNEHLVLLSMATDGILAVWNFMNIIETNLGQVPNRLNNGNNPAVGGQIPNGLNNDNSNLLLSLKLHQSGINSFSYKIIDNNLYLVTGGDDCNLSVTVLDNDLKLITKCIKQRAHDSQITGIVFLNQNNILSTSVDHKVILWKCTINQSEINKLDQQKNEGSYSSNEMDRNTERLSTINLNLESSNDQPEGSHSSNEVGDKSGIDDVNEHLSIMNLNVEQVNNQLIDSSIVELEQCFVYDSCIPDIHGMEQYSDNSICVYGCGLDILEI